MKLTREQWKTLDKMSIKDRLERLEERAYDTSERLSDMDLKEFNKEMDAINDESDTKCLWAICLAMILVGVVVGILICKLAL